MRAVLYRILVLAVFSVSGATAGEVSSPDLKPKKEYLFKPTGALLNGEKTDKPEGVSGIACLPPSGAEARRCLIVNDERRKAQFITIDNGMVAPGDDVELIGKKASSSTLGQKPNISTCPGGEDDFGELDGEGISYNPPYFYVVGSHGCSRKKRKFKLSSFVIARFSIDKDYEPIGNAETTYRLSDLFTLSSALKPFFGQALQNTASEDVNPNGVTIEGISVIGDRVFVGLRAPFNHADGGAYLVEASANDLFASEPGKQHARSSQDFINVIPLALGEDTGIRDLTSLPDGRLLILAGPAQEQKVPYSLFIFDPFAASLKKIGTLKKSSGEVEDAKAEAVALLGPDRVLIMFDGILNGGPREYSLVTPLY
ncbi:DUF3616 domain-containing protein [Methylobacterium fujisawaense]|uniref:DUF3616 domain-containing protein n=1 Tax=Methylobacterium fujisawaense TaxID=107400 RepID=UPI0036F670AC